MSEPDYEKLECEGFKVIEVYKDPAYSDEKRKLCKLENGDWAILKSTGVGWISRKSKEDTIKSGWESVMKSDPIWTKTTATHTQPKQSKKEEDVCPLPGCGKVKDKGEKCWACGNGPF